MKAMTTLGKFFATVLFALAVSALAGCGATKSASASFASVVIKGHTVEEIRNAAGEVFSADGYAVMVRGNEMKFEKEGSRAKQLAYGGIIGDERVNIRVLANIAPLPENSHRFECKAYIVKNPGDATFEEVIKLQNIRSRPYQNLCDQVAKKLK